MTIIRYRLIYKNGTHSAWTTNKAQIEESAQFFNAKIETWIVELP
jgi:hypothetical protein